MRTRTGIVLALSLSTVACATYRVPGVQGDRAARVIADPIVSAGLPVQVVLRSIDSRRIDSRYSTAELPPGRHEILVDCRVAESGASSRHLIVAELESGGHYRLVGIANARRCEAVELEPR